MGKITTAYGGKIMLRHYLHPAPDHGWTACGKEAKGHSTTTDINKVTCGACKLALR